MIVIKRDDYLNKLISRRENGLIKIITGIRRCSKSFLLDPIFKEYLISDGIDENHIIKIDLDDIKNSEYLESMKLYKYVESKIVDNKTHYVLIDEI